MSFRATRRSDCHNCDSDIKAGDPIYYDEDLHRWVHVECPEPKPKEVCQTCFVEKALDGSCLC